MTQRLYGGVHINAESRIDAGALRINDVDLMEYVQIGL